MNMALNKVGKLIVVLEFEFTELLVSLFLP